MPDTVKFEIGDFTDESYGKMQGKLFQIMYMYSEAINLPYIWNKNSDSAEAECIFYRKGTRTIKANSQEIKEMSAADEKFHLSQNGVWLTKKVEIKYIEF